MASTYNEAVAEAEHASGLGDGRENEQKHAMVRLKNGATQRLQGRDP